MPPTRSNKKRRTSVVEDVFPAEENIWLYGQVAASNPFFGILGRDRSKGNAKWKFCYGNSYKNFVYVCDLCHTASKMDHQQVQSHVEEQCHEDRVQAIKTRQQVDVCRFVEVRKAVYGIHNNGPPRKQVERLIGKHLLTDDFSSENVRNDVQRMCLYYERLEPLVILKLAVWKAACILAPPRGIISYHTLVHYIDGGGWKNAMEEHRDDELIVAVVHGVFPFLGIQ